MNPPILVFFREYYAPGDHAAIVDMLNVKATMELAQAAQARGVKKMVDTSSAGIIGVKPDGSAGDEETPMWPGARKNLYFDSKRKVEPLLRAFSREKGFFIASALPSWMWGPHDAAPTPSGQLVLDAFARKLPPAIPPGGCSVADARDVAAGMLRIAESGRSGERYILSGGYAELGEIVANLGAHRNQAAQDARSLRWRTGLRRSRRNLVANHADAQRDLPGSDPPDEP